MSESNTVGFSSSRSLKVEIKFGNPEGTHFRSQNLGFQGRGWLELEAGSIVFSGKQRGFLSFGRKAKIAVNADGIFNLERSGKQIRFVRQYPGPEKSRTAFCFETPTEEEAARVEAMLPKFQTPEFAQARTERRDFHIQLWAATPRVFVTPALVAINCLIFLLMAIAGAGVVELDGESGLLALHPEVHIKWGANFGPLTTDGQWWRLVTSTFLHFGIFHLLFNMWALYAAGGLVERLYGNGFFLLLYLAAGVSGSVASVWWNPKVLSAGASGAIFGVYGALLAYLALQRKSVPLSVTAQLRNSILVCVVFNLFYGFGHTGIDNAAHLGGLAGGVLIGLGLARPLDLEVRMKTARPRLIAGLIVAPLLPAIMWGKVQNSGKGYRQEKRFKAEFRWFVDEEKSILSAWQEVSQKTRSGSMGDSEAALKLQPVIARWQNAYDRLSGSELDDAASSNRIRQLVLQYIQLRRDAMISLVQGLENQDPRKIDEFKSFSSRAEQVLEEMKQDKGRQ